jgi:LysR family transcriptional regulator for bpeEF and oprC
MEIFVRVAECGSFSQAADMLDLANATVTTTVRNLERHLDVTLINRDTRRLKLTEEGEYYLPQAKQILLAASQADEEVRHRLGELRGALQVEVPISIGHALLCPALSQFALRYPEITLSVTLTNQPHHLIEHAIDVAIRMDHVEDADLVAKPVYEAQYVICCTPGLAARLPAHPRELDPRLCLGILPGEGRHPSPWALRKEGELLQIAPAGPLHFNNSDAVLTAACAGVGVVRVLDIFAFRMIERGELVRVYASWSTSGKTFYALTARSRGNSAKVRAFIDFLSQVFDLQRRPDAARAVAVRALRRG